MAKTWTTADQRLAYASGWGVFDNSDHGVRIERLDDPRSAGLNGGPKFESDDKARAHVEAAAAAGDLLAKKALAHVAAQARPAGFDDRDEVTYR